MFMLNPNSDELIAVYILVLWSRLFSSDFTVILWNTVGYGTTFGTLCLWFWKLLTCRSDDVMESTWPVL